LEEVGAFRPDGVFGNFFAGLLNFLTTGEGVGGAASCS
jgi:hypothetical protein